MEKYVVILIMMISCIEGYQEIKSQTQAEIFMEKNSQYPILHIYHNRHFSKSQQFKLFLEVLDEVQNRVSDYCRIIMSDCEKFQPEVRFKACTTMKSKNDNRFMVGYMPSSTFIKFGDKLVQNSANHQIYEHNHDRYTVDELQNFIKKLRPNFFQQIPNEQHFQHFIIPKYVPKLIYLSKDDELPSAVVGLAIPYFLRFKFAYVSDLTQSVIKNLPVIQQYPILFVMKYNFNLQKYEYIEYSSHYFDQNEYQSLKQFYQLHALSEQRDDALFHSIKNPQESNITIISSKAEYLQKLDRTSGFIIISQGPQEQISQKMRELQKNYGLYLSYIKYINKDQTQETFYLYSGKQNFKQNFKHKEIYFYKQTVSEFTGNLTFWLEKNYVILGMRQSYAHVCAINQKKLFNGLVRCLVIFDSDYQSLKSSIGFEFDVGFVSAVLRDENDKPYNGGDTFKNDDFQTIYRRTEYYIRLKVKQTIDNFMENPIRSLSKQDNLHKTCEDPIKLCAVLFISSKKDQTRKQYLSIVAENFLNQYNFLAVDIQCNKQYIKQFKNFNEKLGGFIVYHPKLKRYVRLKPKLTKQNVNKFLNINLDVSKVPLESLEDQLAYLRKCSSEKKSQEQL